MYEETYFVEENDAKLIGELIDSLEGIGRVDDYERLVQSINDMNHENDPEFVYLNLLAWIRLAVDRRNTIDIIRSAGCL